MSSRRTLAELGITDPCLARMELVPPVQDEGQEVIIHITLTRRLTTTTARCINERLASVESERTEFRRNEFVAMVGVEDFGDEHGQASDQVVARLWEEMARLIRIEQKSRMVFDRVVIKSAPFFTRDAENNLVFAISFDLFTAKFPRMDQDQYLAQEMGSMNLDS